MANRKLLILGAAVLASVALVPIATALGNDTGEPPAQAVEGLTALGNGFTYQGRLTDGGNPANGNYDLRFVLYDSDVGGAQVGSTIALNSVPAANGLFTVTLDFGAPATATATATTSPSPTPASTNVWDGNARWIEIAVRSAGSSSYTVLNPRQPISPAPYALYAKAAGGFALPYTASGGTTAGVGTLDITQTGSGIAVAGRNGLTAGTGPGVLGSSAGTGAGVRGETTYDAGYGVIGSGTTSNGTGGKFSAGTGGAGTALEVDGPIKVSGSTPAAFVQTANTGGGAGNNMCSADNSVTVISSPMTDGKSTAMLFVTMVNANPSGYDLLDSPVGVIYNPNACAKGVGKWAIYTTKSGLATAIPNGTKFNVLVINQ